MLSMTDGLRPRPPSFEEFDPGTFDHGWQFFAVRAVEERVSSSTIWPRLSHRAGPLQVTVGTHVWASVHVCAFLAHVPFLPPALPRGGPPSLASFGPLAPAGVAVFLTSLATTVQRARGGCLGVVGSRWRMPPRELSGGGSTFLHDIDLPIDRHDARRLEVVAKVVPQQAVDTTLVSPVQADGHPRRRCAEDGAGPAQRKPPRWEVVGRMKPTLSFASWQRPRRVVSPAS